MPINQTYPAWMFYGHNWTDEAKKRAEKLFSKHIKYEQQSQNFNYWKLTTDGGERVAAMRFTWDSGAIGGNWKKLEEDLATYYSK